MKDMQIIAAVQKLISVAMQASDENYSCFVSYRPHVNGVSIYSYKNGWAHDIGMDSGSPRIIILTESNSLDRLDAEIERVSAHIKLKEAA